MDSTPQESAAVDTSAKESSPAVPTEPQVRDVVIKVPLHVPDQHVEMALGMGSMAVEAITHGALVMFFPTTTQDPQTHERRQAVGHNLMPILNAADVQRILRLTQAITSENMKVANAAKAGVPGAQLDAAISSDIAKDNLTRDAVAKAQGQPGGIIVPQ